ncbi:MAG: hypothetical protein DRP09_20010, partial [Candidatus Thorarchaeota archaeon]
MKHAKQSQLIRYQFKLLSGKNLQQVQEHLADCELCRKELERIRQKYAPLELLREDITASEALISQTIANIGAKAVEPIYKGMKPGESGSVIRKSYLFSQRGMLAAAAAVMILIGGMFIIAQLLDPGTTTTPDTPSDSDDLTHHRIVKTPEPVSKTIVEKGEGVGEPLDVKVVEEIRADSEKLVMGIASDLGGAAGEKPPFAPASNIELVVLPRRDKVQLTIYNSADLTLVR